MRRATRPPSRIPRLAAVLAVAGIALGGCGPVGSYGLGDPLATGPLEDGDFAGATDRLRRTAARCESGAAGREAVLVRAVLELDPRNPAGSPDTAAHLAARYLQLPDAEPAGISMAESLYLLSLDRGASPVRDPVGYAAVAPRFSDCREGAPEGMARIRELPEHPGTPAWRSLMLSERALHSIQAHADSLKAELERIRRALARPSSRP